MGRAQATGVWELPSAPGSHALIAVPESPDIRWSQRIAAALKSERTVFAWPAGDTAGLRCLAKNQEVEPTLDEARVGMEVCRRGPTPSMKRIDGALTPAALATWIQEENEATIRSIANALLSPTGIIPFVGAGMSHDYGAPMWGDFLKLAASSDAKAAVEQQVRDGQYEEAAQLLDSEPNRDHFRQLVAQHLDVTVEEARRRTGPLAILPLLTKGPVITTNFDRVLESFYEAAGKPFSGRAWIAGRRDPIRILNALQQNAHALIKLHGDVRQPDTFTFTALEYEESYGNAQRGKRGVLTDLGNVIYTNRPLLFLGCSLEKDRTLNVLEQVVTQNPYLRHYAVLSAVELESAMDARGAALTRCGIVPLWFPPEEFGQIGVLLERLLEDSSVEDVLPEFEKKAPAQRPFRPLRAFFMPPEKPSPDLTAAHVAKVAESVVKGQVVFFLGNGVHHARLSGDAFYAELATILSVPPGDRYRADVAQQFEDRVGRSDLSRAIERIISGHFSEAWRTHILITSLALRHSRGDVAGPVVAFTTNYDDVLETTLQAASVPYHLFLYQPDGEDAGRFVHRSPEGRLRAIRNPDGVHKLEPEATVVVKMNGGLDALRELPGRFVVTSWDFDELASRIATVIPGAVRRYLSRSLLFLGHGLAEPDVRAFARCARRQRGARPAWAVQMPRRDEGFWRDACGVEILEVDLDTYVTALSKRLRDEFQIET